MRHQSAIKSIQNWASRRGVPTKFFERGTIGNICPGDISAFWYPTSIDMAFLEGLHPEIFLILDHAIVDPLKRFKNDGILSDRRYAFRRAFGGKTAYEPAAQVPYFTVPDIEEVPRLGHNPRNMIIIDSHKWLPPDAHFLMLSLMLEFGRQHSKLCSDLEMHVKFYFTGNISPVLYQAGAELFGLLNELFHSPEYKQKARRENERRRDVADKSEDETAGLWPNILARHLPGYEYTRPLYTRSSMLNPLEAILGNLLDKIDDRMEFARMFDCARLFMTDHGDLADQDVAVCLALGVPILTVPRSPWKESAGVGSSLRNSFPRLSKTFSEEFSSAVDDQNYKRSFDELLAKERCETVSLAAYHELFDACWDRLWDAATTGHRDTQLSGLIDSTATWNRGMV